MFFSKAMLEVVPQEKWPDLLEAWVVQCCAAYRCSRMYESDSVGYRRLREEGGYALLVVAMLQEAMRQLTGEYLGLRRQITVPFYATEPRRCAIPGSLQELQEVTDSCC